jgi:thymidylate synthase
MKPHNNIDTPYLMLLNRIRNEGNVKSDRTNTGTVSLFGNMIKLDVRDGYIPLLTTKKIFYESFIKETVWFISGSTDVKFLKDNGVGIWDEWVIPETSVWRPYTEQEYATAYQKLYKDDWDYTNQVPVAPFKDAYNWLRCHEQELYKQYRKAHPLDANIDNLRAFVQGKVEIPNMKLVSGSIGNGAYGSLWRNWEDTRITTVADYENTHKARGYKLVVKIDDSKCVITRNIDQLSVVVQQLKTNPDSRRIILSAWNPGRLEEAALPPCHNYSQYFSRPKTVPELMDEFLKKGLLQEYLNHVQDDGLDDIENVRAFAVSKGIPVRYLSLMLVTRSQDAPVGTPFNIPQYVMLLNIIANIVDMDVEEFTWVGGDTHIYLNQLELVKEQISRTIMTCRPTVSIKRKLEGIDDVKIEDIQISNYTSHPSINYPIAV